MLISTAFLVGLAGLTGSWAAADSSYSDSSIRQIPIDQFDLPTAYGESGVASNPSDLEAIRNVLAHYPLAIDGKNFDALDLVFTSNAVTNYSAPLNILTPLSAIKSGLKASLAPVTTQHSYGTQVIDVTSSKSALSVTYFIANHFGIGVHAGKIATAYGQYQDTLVKQSGKWRISRRNLVYMGPISGDLSIFS
ncbi:hypothetical protein NQ176_g7329 [Zarea fungicola]|uniref:Uncharacterized protein n=1 Tax=Zarea fungicola TaxID=93591 RepID=A0ACC1MZW8_9HYPO|nr:hypothetical protein NQ176_g7329 [Lecanicillium fungicola]